MYAVTGASGHLGRLAIDALIARGVKANDIVAIVRDPAKVADLAAKGVVVRKGDYLAPETLPAALKGVTRLLLVSSSTFGDRVGQHVNVINAAKAAGVGFIGYTSILRADTSPINLAADHKGTEAALAASGIPSAFLRHGWYNKNYGSSITTGPQFGAIIGAAGEGKINAASRADYAEGDAAVMVSGKPGVYEMAGDSAFTMAELAGMIAKESGKAVVYSNLPEAAYNEALLGFGLPAPVAAILSQADSCIPGGALVDTSKTLSGLIGRPTTPMAETVKAVLAGAVTGH